MKTPPTEKRCGKCGEVKSADEFNNCARNKDGKQTRCKVCSKAHYQANKEKVKAHYQANKEKIGEQAKAYYQANKEKISEQKKAYHQANKEKVKAYRQANKEKISEKNKAYKQANKEKICEQGKTYRQTNKKKISERMKAYHAQPHVKERRNKRLRERYKNDPQYKASRILREMLRRVLNGEAKTESALKSVGYTTEKFWEHIENSFVDGMTVQNHGEVWHFGHIEPLSGFDPKNAEHMKRVNHFSNLKAQFKEENLSDGAKVPDNHQAGLPLRYD